jgi:hypothetical protein
MAVEQRIGRIHRYGQRETVQVYNLVAEDTVEERIYGILENKLQEIARSIGRTDEAGNTLEDFRSEILGYLGGRPDYQDLYKQALMDRDYRRTEQEMERMMEEALRAREALNALTQDLSGFNLEHFKGLEGRYTLMELGAWVRDVILKLGGAAIPDGNFWTLITPESLRQKHRLAPRYERVCFDREVALRTRNADLGGIGHPLVDVLLSEGRNPGFEGAVSGTGTGRSVMAHYLVQRRDERGHQKGRVFNFVYDATRDEVRALSRFDFGEGKLAGNGHIDIPPARERIEAALQDATMQWLPDRQSRAGLQISLTGVSVC